MTTTEAQGSFGRNPMYGLEEAAMDNYSHIERPNLNAPGSQFVPEDFSTSSSATFAGESGVGNIKTTIISAHDKQQPDNRKKRAVSARAPQEHRDSIHNNPLAQYETGLQYDCGEEGVVEQDFDRAMEWYLRAAEQGGVGDAFTNIGCLYLNGFGVTKDFSKAVEWSLKGVAASSKEGDGRAEFSIGVVYHKGGHGVEQDLTRAFDYFLKGAEKGLAEAQEAVGRSYEEGQGVEQDFEKAIGWYKKAGRKGNGSALFRVGNMYHDGRGLSQDYKKAKVQYDRTVRKGSVPAQYNVGTYFELGQGVPRNYISAMEYYILEAKSGNDDAAEAVMRLKDIGVTAEPLPENLRNIDM
ncbi:hypothetical protein BGW39_004929 [Mortierella sp. 14UC]|nr:hypothetical protein BGW39_004929 [Mortierella sp. 14UC]